MERRAPHTTRTATFFPCTTLCRARLRVRASGRRCRPWRADCSTAGFAWDCVWQRCLPLGFVPRRTSVPRESGGPVPGYRLRAVPRSEEHTSELQSLMRISYAVIFLKKKTELKTIDRHVNLKN